MTATTSVWDELDEDQAEARLIVNGRYLIDGKRYTRVTTFIGALDNSYGLTQWKMREVAKGIAGSGALRAELHAADNNQAIDDICERAIHAVGSNEKRDLGSAIHRLTEMVDDGTIGRLEDGDPLTHAVNEYRRLMTKHQLTVVESEQVIVCELLGVAGRFDRIVAGPDGRHLILDVKTGRQKNASFARQFSIYANADHIYDPATGTTRPMPDVDKTEALAMMLPTDGESEGEILVVDIAAGWDDAQLCQQVRERGHRTRNDLVWPLGAVDVGAKVPNPLRPSTAPAIDVADLESRIAEIKATTRGLELLRSRWPADIRKPWPAEALNRIDKVVTNVEQLAAMPDDYWAVQDRVKALDADAYAIVMAWAQEARKAGQRLDSGADPHHRRIVNAMCMLLEATTDADVCRDVVGLAMADDIQPAVPLGAAWAALTDAEVTAVERFATAYRLSHVGDFDGSVGVMFGGDGA